MNANADATANAESPLDILLRLFEQRRLPMILLLLVAGAFLLRAGIRGGVRMFWTLFGLAMAWKFAGGAFLRHLF